MKKNTRNYENLNHQIFEGEGIYEIPVLKPEQFDGCCSFIGFNKAASCAKETRADTGIHFYLDDYQFQRLWAMPNYYLPLLKQFKYVLSPDFSTYMDFPRIIQVYNHYRKHWLGAYFQMHGIKVIPTISWSDEESYDWCFDGEPMQGTVSVSSVGTQMSGQCKELFLAGYQEMVRRLQPEVILFYGNVPEECTGNIVKISAFQEKWRKAVCNGW